MIRVSVAAVIVTFFLLLPGRAVAVEAGDMAPDFALADLQDRTHRLSDYRGSIVLVNFWASWCKECLSEMPSLNSLFTKYAGRGLVVLGVTVDRRPEDAGAAAKKARITFPILLDNKGEVFIKKYAVIGLPTTIIVDRKGIVREILIGTQDFLEKEMKDKMASLIKE